jgi:hypothetical protein
MDDEGIEILHKSIISALFGQSQETGLWHRLSYDQ